LVAAVQEALTAPAPEPVPELVPAGHVLFVCTGNAARSVMAGAIFADLAPHWRATSAGTHVVEGQPISWRTRDALATLGFSAGGHRSRQLRDADLDAADLVVGLAPEHVAYIRRFHPAAAARTATLKRLDRELVGGLAGLPSLDLASVELQGWEEVEDPAGGDIEIFLACAAEILSLTRTLVELLGAG
jgi:protein-tyrosine-phosphatase